MRSYLLPTLILTVLLSGCATKSLVDQNKGMVMMPNRYVERADTPRTTLQRLTVDGLITAFRGNAVQEDDGVYSAPVDVSFRKKDGGTFDTFSLNSLSDASARDQQRGVIYSFVDPGVYFLRRATIGDDWVASAYDAEKCGNISFEIKAGDIIALKGLSPAATTPTSSPVKLLNDIHLAKFDTLTDDYLKIVQEKNARIIDLTSDNPEAFEACAKEMGTGTRMVPF